MVGPCINRDAFPSENPKLAKSPLQMKSLQNQGSRKLEHMRFSIEGRFHHSPRGIQIHCRPTKWEVGASEVLTRMHISSFSQRNSQALQTEVGQTCLKQTSKKKTARNS
uniref:Uncharacterized protein n=1 Tax=Opuntia streptacantha TaxID=393608 RepID=A0A7C9EQM5_OPUST